MHNRLLTSLVIFLIPLFLAFPGYSQTREPTPKGIIAKPPNSSLKIDLELNRSRYRPGGEVEIELDLNKKAFLYLYNIDTEGKVSLLFPNKYEKNNYRGPGKVSLPGKGYSFLAGKEKGTEYLVAIASSQKLRFFSSMDQEEFENNPFPMLSQDARAFATSGRKKITSEVPQKDWGAAWTKVNVTKELSEISVITNPSDAEIYLDGKFAGKTPGTVSVEPGTRKVTIKRQNYETWATTVSVQPYREKRIETELRPTTITRLTVNSTPQGADVYVEGKFRGRTPVSFFTESGNRNIRVSKQGYEDWEETIEVRPQLNRNLEVDLDEIRFSRISLESIPSGAEIYVDGVYKDTTPAKLKLRAGKRLKIALKKEGYQNWERNLTLTPGRERNISANLRAPEKTDFNSPTGKPELSLRVNGGGILGYVFSLGSEIEFNNYVLGGSFRSTGDPEVPQEINWKSEPWDRGEVLNYGPEWEVNFGYELDLFRGLHLRFGSGLAFQPRIHLEPTGSQATRLSSVKPMIIIAKDAYLTIKPHLTAFGGFGIGNNRYTLDLFFHNRRGPILNFGLKF